MGAQPRWFWATILLPEHASGEELVDDIFSEMRAACGEIGASICGGHTEITGGLTRPILCGFMAGEVEKGKLADKRSIRPGDEIILSRGIAIEGTAAVASEMTEKLAGLDPDLLRRARGLFMEPGISVVREALLAARTAEVHGMHDPTEGGLFTGLRELAEAGGVGMEIEEERIPVLPETEAVCARLGIDPMGLLASGALLIAVGPDSAGPILEAYRDNGIPARVIGRAREREFGVMLRRAGELVPLPEFERDEIARVL
jgi:hydrogenase maturation factor